VFRVFKMAAAVVLDLQNVKILGVGRVKRVKMRNRAKFRGDWSNRREDMAIFRFFKMATAAILDFPNVEILRLKRVQEGQNASSCHISWRSVKPLLRYGDFSIFPRWRPSGHPPSLICDAHVWTTHEWHLVVFITV